MVNHILLNSVFLKNLSPLATEDVVRDFLLPHLPDPNEILKIDFKFFPGSTQRYCQVDFKTSAGVTAATSLNGQPLLGVPLVLSVIDPVKQATMVIPPPLLGGHTSTLLIGGTPTTIIPPPTTVLPAHALPPVASGLLASQLRHPGYLLPPRETESQQLMRTIHVTNLPQTWNLQDVIHHLATYVKQLDIMTLIVTDSRIINGASGAFGDRVALVEFKTAEMAEAVRRLPQECRTVDGREMTISQAKTTVTEREPDNVSFDLPPSVPVPVAYQQLNKLKLQEKVARARALAQRLTMPGGSNLEAHPATSATAPEIASTTVGVQSPAASGCSSSGKEHASDFNAQRQVNGRQYERKTRSPSSSLEAAALDSSRGRRERSASSKDLPHRSSPGKNKTASPHRHRRRSYVPTPPLVRSSVRRSVSKERGRDERRSCARDMDDTDCYKRHSNKRPRPRSRTKEQKDNSGSRGKSNASNQKRGRSLSSKRSRSHASSLSTSSRRHDRYRHKRSPSTTRDLSHRKREVPHSSLRLTPDDQNERRQHYRGSRLCGSHLHNKHSRREVATPPLASSSRGRRRYGHRESSIPPVPHRCDVSSSNYEESSYHRHRYAGRVEDRYLEPQIDADSHRNRHTGRRQSSSSPFSSHRRGNSGGTSSGARYGKVASSSAFGTHRARKELDAPSHPRHSLERYASDDEGGSHAYSMQEKRHHGQVLTEGRKSERRDAGDRHRHKRTHIAAAPLTHAAEGGNGDDFSTGAQSPPFRAHHRTHAQKEHRRERSTEPQPERRRSRVRDNSKPHASRRSRHHHTDATGEDYATSSITLSGSRSQKDSYHSRTSRGSVENGVFAHKSKKKEIPAEDGTHQEDARRNKRSTPFSSPPTPPRDDTSDMAEADGPSTQPSALNLASHPQKQQQQDNEKRLRELKEELRRTLKRPTAAPKPSSSASSNSSFITA